jgi:molybdopterin/thiamine biosynthesis adenylyltransferase
VNESSFLSRRNSRTNLYGRGARPLDPARWISLAIDPAYAETYAGQVALLTAANLIGRMTPSVAMSVPGGISIRDPLPWAGQSLSDVLFEQLFAATPADRGGRFAARAPEPGDVAIAIGRRTVPGALLVHGCGWDSYFGADPSPVCETNIANPCGPAFAAILCGAHLLAEGLDAPAAGYLCNTLHWSARAAPAGAPQPDTGTDLGELWTIGTGSVGTAALYFLTLFTRRFEAALIDKDYVEIENLDRSPIFIATDDERPKVDASADYLRSVGVVSIKPERATLGESKLWRTRQEGTPDLLIAAANEDHVRFQIEADMPPIQIYGTTGKNWQASVIRHIPLLEPCSLCLFPDNGTAVPTACATGKVARSVDGKQIDAALPFLSFAAGLMTAAEILKLRLPGYPFSKSITQYSARAEEKLITAQLSPRQGCLCQSGRDKALHQRMIGATRYAPLSLRAE